MTSKALLDLNWPLLLSIAGLPVLTSPNSKEPEARKLQIVANHFAMQVVKASPVELLAYLDTIKPELDGLIDVLQSLSESLTQIKLENEKLLNTPCQTVETN